MAKNKYFEILIFLILFFILAWLINATKFLFVPIFKYIGAIAFPLIVSGILYYITKPIMSFLERKLNIKRIWAIIIVFIGFLGTIVLFVIYLWPILRQQTNHFIESVPGMIATLKTFLANLQLNYMKLPEEFVFALDNFSSDLPKLNENIAVVVFEFMGNFIGQVITLAAGLVMVPFFLFFMLKDGHKFLPFVLQIFSEEKSKNLRSLAAKINKVLSSFIQGQLFVSFVVGVLLFIGYLIIDLDYALILALFGMLTNVIPYLGPFIAVIPALFVGTIQDPMNLVWVSVVMIVAQQIESNLVSPKILGKTLDIHPLTVMTVVVASGSIAGFLGVLFAVPVYTIIKTIVVHFYSTLSKKKL